jgi:hypothetical protein
MASKKLSIFAQTRENKPLERSFYCLFKYAIYIKFAGESASTSTRQLL